MSFNISSSAATRMPGLVSVGALEGFAPGGRPHQIVGVGPRRRRCRASSAACRRTSPRSSRRQCMGRQRVETTHYGDRESDGSKSSVTASWPSSRSRLRTTVAPRRRGVLLPRCARPAPSRSRPNERGRGAFGSDIIPPRGSAACSYRDGHAAIDTANRVRLTLMRAPRSGDFMAGRCSDTRDIGDSADQCLSRRCRTS